MAERKKAGQGCPRPASWPCTHSCIKTPSVKKVADLNRTWSHRISASEAELNRTTLGHARHAGAWTDLCHLAQTARL